MTEQRIEPTVPDVGELRRIQARLNSALMNRMMAERFLVFMPHETRAAAQAAIDAEEVSAPVLTERR